MHKQHLLKKGNKLWSIPFDLRMTSAIIGSLLNTSPSTSLYIKWFFIWKIFGLKCRRWFSQQIAKVFVVETKTNTIFTYTCTPMRIAPFAWFYQLVEK